jgi:hypothetical protein
VVHTCVGLGRVVCREKDKQTLSELKGKVLRLRSRFRGQKDQTDDVCKWRTDAHNTERRLQAQVTTYEGPSNDRSMGTTDAPAEARKARDE